MIANITSKSFAYFKSASSLLLASQDIFLQFGFSFNNSFVIAFAQHHNCRQNEMRTSHIHFSLNFPFNL